MDLAENYFTKGIIKSALYKKVNTILILCNVNIISYTKVGNNKLMSVVQMHEMM